MFYLVERLNRFCSEKKFMMTTSSRNRSESSRNSKIIDNSVTELLNTMNYELQRLETLLFTIPQQDIGIYFMH